jgi:hypothetical protein
MIEQCCFLRLRTESYRRTIVSNEPAASIFKVEECSSALKAGSSKTLIFIYQTTYYISEDSTLHSHRCENLKFYNVMINCKSLQLELHDTSYTTVPCLLRKPRVRHDYHKSSPLFHVPKKFNTTYIIKPYVC